MYMDGAAGQTLCMAQSGPAPFQTIDTSSAFLLLHMHAQSRLPCVVYPAADVIGARMADAVMRVV